LTLDAETWTDSEGRFQLTAVPGPGIVFVWSERPYLPSKLAAEDDNDDLVHLDYDGVKVFKTSAPDQEWRPDSVNAHRVVRIPADAPAFTADLTVAAGVQRRVQIVGPDGQPVSGAWVANDRPLGGFSPKPLAGAEVLVHALDPNKPRRIFAQHDGKKLAGTITLDGKETGPAVLRLQPTATVIGRVLDSAGNLLKDVRVRPIYAAEPEIGIWLHGYEGYMRGPVFSDAEGRFALPNIPASVKVQFEARKNNSEVRFDLRWPWVWMMKPGEVHNLGDWKAK
jgi:hypothetical protein